MNISKNILKVTMGLALLFLFSCEKDQVSNENNSLTDEINAVVTKYNDGDDKIEFPWYPGFQKNEEVSSASLDHALKIRHELDKSCSKQTTYLKSAGNTVGVIKDGTCGSYKELMVFMDCEDSGAASSESGYNGDCGRDSNGNITLRFCVVNGAYFNRTNSNYAVLDLSAAGSGWPTGVSKVQNWMYNENHRNRNACTLEGVNNMNKVIGTTVVSSDGTLLGYYYYPSSNYTSFPPLNISYGVFGSFGANQGTIFSDNEDGSSSWISLQKWSTFSGTGLEPNVSYPSSIPNIVNVDGNSNTTMYFSKVIL